MLGATFDAPTLITTGVIVVLVIVLGYRLLNRDPTVKSTRWGLFVERDHHEEGEVWTVDPLPPPTPPPPLPPRPPDDDETNAWPKREEAE